MKDFISDRLVVFVRLRRSNKSFFMSIMFVKKKKKKLTDGLMNKLMNQTNEELISKFFIHTFVCLPRPCETLLIIPNLHHLGLYLLRYGLPINWNKFIITSAYDAVPCDIIVINY